MRKMLTSLDLGGNQLIAACLEALGNNPAGAKTGQVWFNTATKYATIYDGTAVQQLATVAYVQSVATGDMRRSVYDTDGDGVVDAARAAPWSGITGKPATFTPSAHTHVAADISDLAAFVNNAVAALVDTAAGANDNLDTLGEIITRIQANGDALAAQLKRHTATIGDGAATSIAVTHNFGTRDVVVTVYEVANNADVIADVVRTSANVVTIGFAAAPTAGQYRVVIHA